MRRMLPLAAARASGAHPIVIMDIEPTRLQFAQEFVPSCRIYRVDPSLDAAESGRRIQRLFAMMMTMKHKILNKISVRSTMHQELFWSAQEWKAAFVLQRMPFDGEEPSASLESANRS